MEKRFTLKWKIKEKDAEKNIKRFLQDQQISKSALTDIKLHGGDILINGQHVTVRHCLKIGEELTVIFPKEEASSSLMVESIPLNILFEDEFILVLMKPPFMNTIPSREHPTGSLANGLMGYYEIIGLETSPHIVTRLDRNTSGIVLVAKHRHIHHLLSAAQKKGKIHREYEAFVEGILVEHNGTIEAPIARKPDSIIERTVLENGQFARTHYELKTQHEQLAHVRLQLDTGRTHQIRVHMAYIGHPLVGDDLYGGSTELLNRQALHCHEIQFTHPIDQKRMKFSCPLPEDMASLLDMGQNC